MKITLGDVTIVIEPGDDPNQVIAIASAIGQPHNSATSVVTAESTPSRKRVPRCKGRGECEGKYHDSEAKRQHEFMCETYEYIASYKHGRSSQQVADWAGISATAASSRIATLVKVGLVVRPGKGYVYVATS